MTCLTTRGWKNVTVFSQLELELEELFLGQLWADSKKKLLSIGALKAKFVWWTGEKEYWPHAFTHQPSFYLSRLAGENACRNQEPSLEITLETSRLPWKQGLGSCTFLADVVSICYCFIDVDHGVWEPRSIGHGKAFSTVVKPTGSGARPPATSSQLCNYGQAIELLFPSVKYG